MGNGLRHEDLFPQSFLQLFVTSNYQAHFLKITVAFCLYHKEIEYPSFFHCKAHTPQQRGNNLTDRFTLKQVSV